MLGALSPAAVTPLVTTIAGQALVGVSLVLDVAAVLLLRRIAGGVEA